MSSPRSDEVPQRLLALLDQLIAYEMEFLEGLKALRETLRDGLSGTTSPEVEKLLPLQERVRELLRSRNLKEPDGGPQA